ncbi:hypothetical protein ABT275_44715 [Streptomyces sp. NPDC001185]|uniref:hypothetical protein n=1 Tax=Streptomyces sp. NPDC001185 TaxID=3154380 RepID=UPI003327E1E4
MISGVWREAEEDRDSKALGAFVCTLPSPPRPPTWEKRVQKFFQSGVWDRIRELPDADARVRVIEDEQGVAAAYVHLRFDADHPEYRPAQGYADRLIGYLAIATRYRHLGGGFADEALTDALYSVLDAEPQADAGVVVWGKVDHRNKASKRMLTRNGFQYRSSFPDDGPLEHWALRLQR